MDFFTERIVVCKRGGNRGELALDGADLDAHFCNRFKAAVIAVLGVLHGSPCRIERTVFEHADFGNLEPDFGKALVNLGNIGVNVGNFGGTASNFGLLGLLVDNQAAALLAKPVKLLVELGLGVLDIILRGRFSAERTRDTRFHCFGLGLQFVCLASELFDVTVDEGDFGRQLGGTVADFVAAVAGRLLLLFQFSLLGDDCVLAECSIFAFDRCQTRLCAI